MSKRKKLKPKKSKRKRLAWDVDEVVSFYLASFRVKLYVTRGASSYFQFADEDGFAGVYIDVAEDRWWRIVESVWHELLEYCMCVHGLRFSPSGALCRSSQNVIFVMNHDGFSNMVSEVTNAWSVIEKPLKEAWREHTKLLKEKTS